MIIKNPLRIQSDVYGSPERSKLAFISQKVMRAKVQMEMEHGFHISLRIVLVFWEAD